MQLAIFITVCLIVLIASMVAGIKVRGDVDVRIKEGRHYPSLWQVFQVAALVGFFGRKTFAVRFFEGTDTRDEHGTWGQSNKVLGRTRGFATPRQDSTRLAWLGLGNGYVKAWTMIERDKTPVFVNPIHVSLGRPVWHDVDGFGIPCVPYYGGDNPAPNDMRFYIRRIDDD